MNESAQIGVFPGLIEPAMAAAEKLILEPTAAEYDIESIPGFKVARADAIFPDRAIHTFEYKGEKFVIFQ